MINLHVVDENLRFPCLSEFPCSKENILAYDQLAIYVDSIDRECLLVWHMDVFEGPTILEGALSVMADRQKLTGVVLYKGGDWAYANDRLEAQTQLQRTSVRAFAFPTAVPTGGFVENDGGDCRMKRFVDGLKKLTPSSPPPFELLLDEFPYSRAALAALRLKDAGVWDDEKIKNSLRIEHLQTEKAFPKSVRQAARERRGQMGTVDSLIVRTIHDLRYVRDARETSNTEAIGAYWEQAQRTLKDTEAAVQDIQKVMKDDMLNFGWNVQYEELDAIVDAMVHEFALRNQGADLQEIENSSRNFRDRISSTVKSLQPSSWLAITTEEFDKLLQLFDAYLPQNPAILLE